MRQSNPWNPAPASPVRAMLLREIFSTTRHQQAVCGPGNKDGTVFYLVIDYDSPVNEEEEQYQTYFLNLVDAADLSALVGEEENGTGGGSTAPVQLPGALPGGQD